MKYSIELKTQLINRFVSGESMSSICAESGVPKSTLYSWVQPHCKIKCRLEHPPTLHQYTTLKQ